MFRRMNFLWMVFTLAVSAGCERTPKPDAITVTVTPERTVLSPTETVPLQTPVAQATDEVAMETVEPTVTATEAPTVAPMAQATVSVTPMATATLMVTGEPTATPDWSEMGVRESTMTSPDGAWIVERVVAIPDAAPGDMYYTHFTVRSADGNTSWTIIDAWRPFGLGYTFPEPVRWSEDQPYFYFTNYPVPDGCILFVNGRDLHRLDLRDGTVVELLPPSGTWVSLSPNEDQVVYAAYGERDLVVRDLLTGEEQHLSLEVGKPFELGHIVWSPDGTAVMVTVAIRPCYESWTESTSIVRANVETLERETLIAEDSRRFVTERWPEPDRVLLKQDREQLYWMDPRTGEVTEAGSDG